MCKTLGRLGVIVLALAVLLCGPGAMAATTLFEDDFSDAAASEANWLQYFLEDDFADDGPNWTVTASGTLRNVNVARPVLPQWSGASVATPDRLGRFAIDDGGVLDGQTFYRNTVITQSVDIRFISDPDVFGNGALAGGFALLDNNHPDRPDVYWSLFKQPDGFVHFDVLMSPENTSQVPPDVFIDGVALPATFDRFQWHHVDFTIQNNIATVTLDGTTVISGAIPLVPQDGSMLTEGTAGLYTFGLSGDPLVSPIIEFDNYSISADALCPVTDDFEDAAASLAFWYDGNGDGGTEFNLNNSVVVDSADPTNSVYLVAPADGPSTGFAMLDDNPAADWARLHVIDEFTIRVSLRTADVDVAFPANNYFGVFWGVGGVNITGDYVAVLNSTFQLTGLAKIIDGVVITLLIAPFTVIEGVWYEMEINSTDTEFTFRVGEKGGPLTTIGTVPNDNNGKVVGTTGVFVNPYISAEFDDFALCANDVIADVGREGVETGFTDPSVLSDFTILNGVFAFEDITPGDPALLGIADSTNGDPIVENLAVLAAKGGASYFTDELVVSAVMQAKGAEAFDPILFDFETPATGSDLSVVGGMSFTNADIFDHGEPFGNVLINTAPSFTIEFQADVDSLSFLAIGGSEATGFNAEVRDEFGGLLDSIFLSGPQGGTPVVLTGSGIRSLTISDGGFDTAIDNLFIEFAPPPPGRDMGLFWGNVPLPNGNVGSVYYVEIEAEEQHVSSGKFINGVFQFEFSFPLAVEEFTWYDLAVVSKQGLIQIWLDGELIIEYDDSASPLTEGMAGVYTEGAANFDNFGLLAKRVPTPGGLNIDPDVVNLKSHGNYLTAYIEVPAGFDVANIDLGTVLLRGVIPAESSPTAIGDDDNDGIPDLMVKFDRQAAIANIPLVVGDQTLDVTWLMTDGTPFIGQDTVRVIKPGKN